MPNDLISKSVLIEQIKKFYDVEYGEALINPRDFLNMVNDISIAYDVEKVVEQIKESYGACDECRGYKSHECSAAHCQIREVIDIVRNGGKE